MQELHKVRRFAAQKDRVESGPIMFGEDWPGIFIRGDEAFAHTFALKAAIQHPGIDAIHRSLLEGLLTTLQSSDCRNNDAFPSWHRKAEEWT